MIFFATKINICKWKYSINIYRFGRTKIIIAILNKITNALYYNCVRFSEKKNIKI